MRTCRFCQSTNLHLILDLGTAPPSNSFLTAEQLEEPETYYPLRLFFCADCGLVQLPEYKKASEIFKDDYPYFSSQSPSNVSHAKEYVDMITERFHPKSVLEIGSNDGYLLQHFSKHISCLGYEPSRGPAEEARKKGIDTVADFFDMDNTMYLIGSVDLICGINVLAHQPDINDFVGAIKRALAPKGVITCEFPHLMRLIDECQFDTVYHEHYSYFSLMTICTIFQKHGLEVFDVDEIPEHGGSLRIYACHKMARADDRRLDRVADVLRKEHELGMNGLAYYRDLQGDTDKIKRNLVSFLIFKSRHSSIAAYGAPAKASTLLNYCGIGPDLVSFTVDRSPYKQGMYLPGSRIPVVCEDVLKEMKPDYILILPWNLKTEIMEQLAYCREWGAKFVVAIPGLEVL